MKVTYTGKTTEFDLPFQKKLDARFAKLSKIIEKRGEKEAHVILTHERHLVNAEITTNCFDHALVGVGSAGDPFTAVCAAIDKLEKQIMKLRARWRDTVRDPKGVREKKESWDSPTPIEPIADKGASADTGKIPQSKVFRVNHNDSRKPMTLEEALLEMESEMDYVVYHDADKNCVSVLVRRRDGNFDLIES